ncbi:MAG: hypothetical protein JXA97_14240, partial [Anaerolineales bacterium]|nr:hypothetical protein [Anaerolineales bacterium]
PAKLNDSSSGGCIRRSCLTRNAARLTEEVLSGASLEGPVMFWENGLRFEADLVEDAFEVLPRLMREGRRYDMVVLDPPAFARTHHQTEGALAAYRRLTLLGLSVLKQDGILVQASCSSRVAADDFFRQVHRAAGGAGRPLTKIARTGHALDHPITYPQGTYLKCLFAKAAPAR